MGENIKTEFSNNLNAPIPKRHRRTVQLSITILLLVILAAVIVGAMFFGSIDIETKVVWNLLTNRGLAFLGNGESSRMQDSSFPLEKIIMGIRMPRTLMAAITGAILSLVGLLMQTTTKNSLADPYVLGISSGASAGAVSAIVWGWFSSFGIFNVYIGAFCGSIIATMGVIFLQGKFQSPTRLILAGMGISGFFTAATGLIVFSSTNEAQVRSATFWMLGSLTGIHYDDLTAPAVALVLIVAFVLMSHKELDLLLLGIENSVELGLNYRSVQRQVVIISSLAMAVLVSQVGIIGFVGLIIPHITKYFSGLHHRLLSLHTMLIGAIFMVIVDGFSRTVYAPQELPVGIVTAFIGAPIFLSIVRRTYKNE